MNFNTFVVQSNDMEANISVAASTDQTEIIEVTSIKIADLGLDNSQVESGASSEHQNIHINGSEDACKDAKHGTLMQQETEKLATEKRNQEVAKKERESELNKFVLGHLTQSGRQSQHEPSSDRVRPKEQAVAHKLDIVNEEDEYKYEDRNISENEPLMRTDVVREADVDDSHEYPEEGWP